MITLAPEEKCTGCMACVQSCPKQCIHICADSQGHTYPEIDDKICISCYKCKNSCPILYDFSASYPKKAYAVWSLDEKLRKASASGGAAAELYKTAIHNGWWICGVVYTENFHVEHILTNSAQKIKAFQQSKYVYSEVNDVYCKIKKKLEQGNGVLFISLPCKIAGLKGYLRKEYENLITVDIVCHGTPSHKILYEHIMNVQGKNKATHLTFRKDNEFLFELKASNRTIYKRIGRQDTYLAAFLEGLNYRKSCYQCPYAKPERVGDLTICDFWGLGTKIPFEHPYTGSISAILVNSVKGAQFFENSRSKLFVEERPVEEAVEGNHQLNEPTKMHPQNEQFTIQYEQLGFEQAVKSCLGLTIREDKKQLHRRQLKQRLRKVAGIFISRYRS